MFSSLHHSQHESCRQRCPRSPCTLRISSRPTLCSRSRCSRCRGCRPGASTRQGRRTREQPGRDHLIVLRFILKIIKSIISKYFIIIIIIIIMIMHIIDLQITGIRNKRLVLLLKMLNDRGDFLLPGSKRLPSAPILRIWPAL